MNAKEIRNTFLEFFKSKNHEIVPSAPLVIKNDPTLMFTNAGMNQFKDLFLGNAPIKYPRIADTQKCLRVSGKHNDLEEVGIDTYHHTMFEMLGNWSFGDYFKEEAIAWAWELLVDVYKIDKNRLYFTVFEGDEEDGTQKDETAYEIWKNLLLKNGLSEDRILYSNKKDNFWEMGDTGPCGPCSEIHVDLRDDSEIEKIPGRELVNKDHPQVIEIWNLVFMEFNRMADGKLVPLKNKHVDTGMGFERLAMVLQGKKSNYDTDVFSPIINKICSITNFAYTQSDDKKDIAIRVIADHVRAVAFAIADGQLPSNNGAGYVIRRILRRAIRYGYSYLNTKEAFIYQLVEVLAQQLGTAFPELINQKELIVKVIKEEEESFLNTLEKGIQKFNQYISTSYDKTIQGDFAFELYDTYGFPIDLTQLMASEAGYHVDMPGFTVALQKQKDRSRNATKIEAKDWIILKEDDVEEFIGYDYLDNEVYITKYRKVTTKGKTWYQLVFNITPFYPEGGGQVGDKGIITNQNETIKIVDTQKENNLIIHYAEKLPQQPAAKFKAIVDKDTRKLTACNHTATHLLHEALRIVLGDHVEQRGSLVNDEYLRFDFSHFQKLTDNELDKIEKLVNDKIKAAIELKEYRNLPIEKAKEAGAMMLFGEKYGDVVRMIQFDTSKELCGGTHVKNTSEIKLFKIKSEGSVAAGIRRIEAVTNINAANYLKEQWFQLAVYGKKLIGIIDNETLEAIAQIKLKLENVLKSILPDLPQINIENNTNVEKLNVLKEAINDLSKAKVDLEIITKLQKIQKQLIKKEASKSLEEVKTVKKYLLEKIEEKNGIKVIAQKVSLNDSNAIKQLAFQLKAQYPDLYLVIGAEVNGKPNLTIAIGDKAIAAKGLNAVEIIRSAAQAIQGGGGGQPFFATAGGKNLEGLEEAIEKAKQVF